MTQDPGLTPKHLYRLQKRFPDMDLWVLVAFQRWAPNISDKPLDLSGLDLAQMDFRDDLTGFCRSMLLMAEDNT